MKTRDWGASSDSVTHTPLSWEEDTSSSGPHGSQLQPRSVPLHNSNEHEHVCIWFGPLHEEGGDIMRFLKTRRMCLKVKTQNLPAVANSHVFSLLICPPHMLSIRHVSRCLPLQFRAHAYCSCEFRRAFDPWILDFLAVMITWHVCSSIFKLGL